MTVPGLSLEPGLPYRVPSHRGLVLLLPYLACARWAGPVLDETGRADCFGSPSREPPKPACQTQYGYSAVIGVRQPRVQRPRRAFWIWEDGTGRWSITTELEEDTHPFNGTLVFSLFPNRREMSSSPRWIPPPRALIQAEAQDCQQGVWSS